MPQPRAAPALAALREARPGALEAGLAVLEAAGLRVPAAVRDELARWERAVGLRAAIHAARTRDNYQDGVDAHAALRLLGVPKNYRKVLHVKYRGRPDVLSALNREWSFAMWDLYGAVRTQIKQLRGPRRATLGSRFDKIVPGKRPKVAARQTYRETKLERSERRVRKAQSAEAEARKRLIAAKRITTIEGILEAYPRLPRGFLQEVRRRASELLAPKRGRPIDRPTQDGRGRFVLSEKLGKLLYGRA